MFTIVNEKTLSTEDRKALNSELFGLPKQKKFPLIDEEHVRKAIQFFKYCPPDNRNELAKNIYKRMKELDMNVNVSKDNPFIKYVNTDNIVVIEGNTEISIDIDLHHYDKLSPILKQDISYIQDKKIYSEHDLLSLEEYIVDIDLIDGLQKAYDTLNTKHGSMINPLSIVNSAMRTKYRDFMQFIRYDIKSDIRVFYMLLDDIFFSISMKKYGDVGNIDTEISILNTLCQQTTCNRFYVYRELMAQHLEYELALHELAKSDNNKCVKNVTDFNEKILSLANSIRPSMMHTQFYDVDVSRLFTLVMHNTLDIKFNSITDYLYQAKIEIEKQLYIIDKSLNSFDKIHWQPFTSVGELQFGNDGIRKNGIKEILTYLDHTIRPENFSSGKLQNMRLQLTPSDVVRLTKCRAYMDTLFIGKDMYSDNVYYGIKDSTVHLITSDRISNNIIYFIELNQENVFSLVTKEPATSSFHIITLTFHDEKEFPTTALTEGISIDKDGNMKFTFSSKKSYMDEYMENHKMLMENWTNKNYKGVKQNLAFAFALINIIERNKKFKARDPELLKARAFLTNDFKTYLTKLQKVEPNFDFGKYYKESEYDKLIVDVPLETLVGIKKIVKALLM